MDSDCPQRNQWETVIVCCGVSDVDKPVVNTDCIAFSVQGTQWGRVA